MHIVFRNSSFMKESFIIIYECAISMKSTSVNIAIFTCSLLVMWVLRIRGSLSMSSLLNRDIFHTIMKVCLEMQLWSILA